MRTCLTALLSQSAKRSENLKWGKNQQRTSETSVIHWDEDKDELYDVPKPDHTFYSSSSSSSSGLHDRPVKKLKTIWAKFCHPRDGYQPFHMIPTNWLWVWEETGCACEGEHGGDACSHAYEQSPDTISADLMMQTFTSTAKQ